MGRLLLGLDRLATREQFLQFVVTRLFRVAGGRGEALRERLLRLVGHRRRACEVLAGGRVERAVDDADLHSGRQSQLFSIEFDPQHLVLFCAIAGDEEHLARLAVQRHERLFALACHLQERRGIPVGDELGRLLVGTAPVGEVVPVAFVDLGALSLVDRRRLIVGELRLRLPRHPPLPSWELALFLVFEAPLRDERHVEGR